MDVRILRHDVVDSTSERAFAALESGTARHGDVHVARAQTSGRGRLGRRWVSAPGEGLYLSLVLRPGPPPIPPPAATMAGGLAVLDAVRELGLDGARLDWPNDVVHGDAKLCGVLVESRGFRPSEPHYVVGVGLNVLQREFPSALQEQRAVTSLALLGVAASVEDALAALVPALSARVEAAQATPRTLARDYLDATHCRGRQVRVALGSHSVQGELVGLDLETGLRLACADGVLEQVRLEHVRAVDPTGAPD